MFKLPVNTDKLIMWLNSNFGTELSSNYADVMLTLFHFPCEAYSYVCSFFIYHKFIFYILLNKLP